MPNEHSGEESKWGKLSADIKTETTRYYKQKIVVSKADLERLWNVSPKTIQRYIKDGMPKCEELSRRNFQIFYKEECEEWKNENIDKKQSNRVNKSKSSNVDASSDNDDEITTTTIEEKIRTVVEKLDIETTSGDEAERLAGIMTALEKTLKVGKASEGMLPAKDTKNVLIEMALIISGSYKKLSKSLPRECKNLSEEKLQERLEVEFKKELDNIRRFLKGKLSHNNIKKATGEKLIDIVNEAQEAIDRGANLDEIINALGKIHEH